MNDYDDLYPFTDKCFCISKMLYVYKSCISILYSRIGDTSLQEKINTENVTKVNSYLEKYEKIFGSLGNYLLSISY